MQPREPTNYQSASRPGENTQWPRPWTEHTWAANLHCKLTLRHRTRFAAKNKRREPEFFFGGETVSGFFLSALWKKIEFQFRRGAHFAAKKARNLWVFYNAPCRKCKFGLRPRTHFAAKKPRIPGVFFGGETVSGSFSAPSGEKSN